MTIDELAQTVNGIVEGDGSGEILGLAGLQEAREGDLSFLANPRYASAMATTQASAVVVEKNWSGPCSCVLIRAENPDEAFGVAAALLAPPPVTYPPGIHPTAVVASDAEIGEDVVIGPHCVLEPGVKVGSRTALVAECYLGHGVAIGEDCRLYPHVSVRERCRVGNRAIIHNGVVIGCDGFGYTQENGAWKKIPQNGVVEIGNDVEIGGNSVIDRARFGKTRIDDGAKLDNLVHIAHNVHIGANSALAGQVGVAGSATIGKNAQFGGQSGVAGHVSVGDGVIAVSRTGVSKDWPAGSLLSGFPAMLHKKARKIHAHTMRLPEFKKKLAELEDRLSDLEKQMRKDKQGTA